MKSSNLSTVDYVSKPCLVPAGIFSWSRMDVAPPPHIVGGGGRSMVLFYCLILSERAM